MNLGIALRHRFRRDGDHADLDAAVEAGMQAVDADPRPGASLASRLANLANALHIRSEHGGGERDLDDAVECGRRAETMIPAGDSRRVSVLTALGNALQVRTARSRRAADATEGIGVRRAAVRECGDDDPRLSLYLTNLGAGLLDRYRLARSAEDLDEAVECFRRAEEHPAASDESRATSTANLANALHHRWEDHGDPADLEGQLAAAERALDAAPAGHPVQIEAMRVLAGAISARFEHDGDPGVLDREIDIRRRVLAAGRDPIRDSVLLGTALVNRGQHAGIPTDLAAGIEMLQQVARRLPEHHDERSAALRQLSVALHARYSAEGNPGDLEDAVRLIDEAVSSAVTTVDERAASMSDLPVLLMDRYAISGEIADLERAVAVARTAAELAEGNLRVRRAATVNTSIALRTLFERRGQADDIEAALAEARNAVDAADGGPGRAAAWSALGSAWQARYERGSQLSDLRNAVQAHRMAADAGSAASGSRVAVLRHNLGNVLTAWYHASGEPAVLDEAAASMRTAVAATHAESPERPGSLTGLGITLRARYQKLGHTDDLNDAVASHREAVSSLGVDRPARRSMLAHLANALETRSRVIGDLDDMRAAVSARRKACGMPPQDHPDRCATLTALGHSLCALAEHNGPALTHEAAGLFREASSIHAAPPQHRVAAARAWGETAHELGDIRQAADGFESAVELLTRVAWHGLDQETRERLLAGLSGLAADAAAAAVLAGRRESAIELIEQGRSVLWTQLLRLRSDLTALADAAPELELRLREVGARLAAWGMADPNNSASDPDSTIHGAAEQAVVERRIRTRWELAREWDDIIARVRLVPGFESFHRPMSYQELSGAVQGGPLAVVNISRIGCHALVLIPQSKLLSVVELPEVTFSSTAEQVGKLLIARGRGPRLEQRLGFAEANRVTMDVLRWIQLHITGPVLGSEAVRGAFAGSTGPRRIWWCPSGPAAMLPLHAAMASISPDDDDASPPQPQIPVSSYTPTIAALRRCRAAADARARSEPGEQLQLAIGMPETPGARPLPAVEQELAALRRWFPSPSAGLQLVSGEATIERVLTELPRRPWVHWACHAGQDETSPRLSAFLLGDGPLTVQDLTGVTLSGPRFAYLSACETATGSARLVDEALHLAAATQLLGYPHVIATMWTIGDDSASLVADKVYEKLNATGTPDARDAALALDAAVDDLRRLCHGSPLLWAPFIHLGP